MNEKIIKRCISKGHESVLEHVTLSFVIVCDRGVSHEIVRHRIASYSQESTRYVAFDKHADGMAFIDPLAEAANGTYDENTAQLIFDTLSDTEDAYLNLRDANVPPQIARAILPNAVATKLVMTANIREWRGFLKLRCAKDAHPAIRTIANKVYKYMTMMYPIFVEDIDCPL